jgi:hypothetical protein
MVRAEKLDFIKLCTNYVSVSCSIVSVSFITTNQLMQFTQIPVTVRNWSPILRQHLKSRQDTKSVNILIQDTEHD